MDQATEFQKRVNMPGSYVSHMGDGARYHEVIVKIRGIEIARKSTVFKRGKVSSVSYILPPLDASDPLLAP